MAVVKTIEGNQVASDWRYHPEMSDWRARATAQRLSKQNHGLVFIVGNRETAADFPKGVTIPSWFRDLRLTTGYSAD